MKEKALSIRLPEELYKKLYDLAEEEGRTLNAQANQLLLKGFIRVAQEKRAIKLMDEENVNEMTEQTKSDVG